MLKISDEEINSHNDQTGQNQHDEDSICFYFSVYLSVKLLVITEKNLLSQFSESECHEYRKQGCNGKCGDQNGFDGITHRNYLNKIILYK